MNLNLDQAPTNVLESSKQELHGRALEHLREALALLDAAEAPGQIAARIDHAIHDLYLAAARLAGGACLDQIERNATPQ